MQAARKHGVIVSYDLNYRESLWKSFGGKKRAQELNRRIAPLVDVMLGNEEDFSAALGCYDVPGVDEHLSVLNPGGFKQMIRKVAQDFSFQVVATTLRRAITASRNDWGAICYSDGDFFQRRPAKISKSSIGLAEAIPCIGLDLRFARRKRSAVGRRVRRRPRRSGHDHAWRHLHGHAGRSPASNARSRIENCPLTRRRLHT